MKFRNIDLMNSLIPICTAIDDLGYGEGSLCPECCSQIHASDYGKDEADLAFSMVNHLLDAERFLKALSPEYISRFEEYEVDYEDLIQSIETALTSPQNLFLTLDVIHDYMHDLWEMCESEVSHYLQMTHPKNHSDLLQIKIESEEGENDEWGILYRAATQSGHV